MENTLGRTFNEFSIMKLEQYCSEIERCLARLTDDQVWQRGGANENAIGNLVLHLYGNVTQRIGAIEGAPDKRVRAAEFAAVSGLSTGELSARLRAAVDAAKSTIANLDDDRLQTRVTVGEFDQTVLEAVYHMEVHFALHAGQIFFGTKRITGEDLGFYKPPAAVNTSAI